jgi:hypothetical protein
VAIAPDVRGHGWSDKPLDQERYTPEALARWLVALLDALAIPARCSWGTRWAGPSCCAPRSWRPSESPGSCCWRRWGSATSRARGCFAG